MPSIKLPAILESLEELMGFISGHAEKEGFNAKKLYEIELTTEEALVNVINYAYPEGTGDVEVSCRQGNVEGLTIEISDKGIPFNILSLPAPDLTADISERKIGGLGVYFIREKVDKIQYRRDEEHNILTFTFLKDGTEA